MASTGVRLIAKVTWHLMEGFRGPKGFFSWVSVGINRLSSCIWTFRRCDSISPFYIVAAYSHCISFYFIWPHLIDMFVCPCVVHISLLHTRVSVYIYTDMSTYMYVL